MREICSYGSVGVPAGNRRHYPAIQLDKTVPEMGTSRLPRDNSCENQNN